MPSSPTAPKLLPARARLSTALRSVALEQFRRDSDDDPDDTKKKRSGGNRQRTSTAPPRSISAALQQLTGRL